MTTGNHGWQAEKCPMNKVTLGKPSGKNDPLREVRVSDSSTKGEERSDENKSQISRERMAANKVKVAENSRSGELPQRSVLMNQKNEKINRKPRFSSARFANDFVSRAFSEFQRKILVLSRNIAYGEMVTINRQLSITRSIRR